MNLQYNIQVRYEPPVASFVKLRRRHSMEIKRAVCGAFNVTMEELLSDSLCQPIARARVAAYWLIKQETRLSLMQIAQAMHRGDHSTIVSGIKRARLLLATNAAFREAYTRAAA